MQGIVAIVGRPNVGKSTLFNRMTQTDRAIVDDIAGVTRDRLYGIVRTTKADDEPIDFVLVDTGGFEKDDFMFQPFGKNLVWQQTLAAIRESDLILFVVDGKSGLHPHDEEILRHLHREQKPFIAVCNKVDGVEKGENVWDFLSLGLDDIHKISAAHNRGVGELKEMAADQLVAMGKNLGVGPDHAIHVSIIGRPNAGKSSILNRLLGEERAVVSEVAGTTRDAIDTPFKYNKRDYILVDTAGMRRKSKIQDRLEAASVVRSIRSIERADVILLILDATEGITEQDARLASLCVDRHKPLAIIVNKWDLIPEKDSNAAKEYAKAVRGEVKGLAFAPILFVSALTNQRVHKLMAMAEALFDQAGQRIGTAKLNDLMNRIVDEHTPALIRNHTKRIKFYYATQVRGHPPTIVVFCNIAEDIQESYKRYMTNRFREELGFTDIPLRILFRDKKKVREREEAKRESHA